METEVLSMVFQITDMATFTMHAISSVTRMTIEECLAQALVINSGTSPYFMVCLPEVVQVVPETTL